MGNEFGKVGDFCWLIIDFVCVRDEWKNYEGLNEGVKGGDVYIFVEIDVLICFSWFYYVEEDSCVKSVKEFWDIYCIFVGYNSVLLFNFLFDCCGLIYFIDLFYVVLLKQGLDEIFGNNLLVKVKVKVMNGCGGKFCLEFLIDNNKEIYFVG